MQAIDANTQLPHVESFHLSTPTESEQRHNNFAYLRLSDGSIGLTYVALDNALEDLQQQLPQIQMKGISAIELAHYYMMPHGWQRALGLAAINAISQHVMLQREDIPAMPENLDLLATGPQARVGMVGYFGRLVEPLMQRGIPVTVIELDSALIRKEPGLEVTLDATRLEGCNQVIISGTTLLNHSLDRMLEHCTHAQHVYLLGPSASCLPEALFDAGVTLVGGFKVTDPNLFADRWEAHGRWRDAGMRYCFSSS